MERPNPSARWDSPMIHCRLGEEFPIDEFDNTKPQTVSRWVRIYKNEDGILYTAVPLFMTEEDARKAIKVPVHSTHEIHIPI
jgi:hypothetical protein